MKVPSTSSLSVYTKVLAHNLNDIRNWASLIGLLLRICWCLLSVFLIYCSDEWKKLVNLIYCFQVLFRMNFKIMYFLMKILGNTPSADSAASRDSLSSQNATWGIVFFSSFYWWHIEYKGWMCERLLNLQEIYVSGQNICIEVYGNSVGTITPNVTRIKSECSEWNNRKWPKGELVWPLYRYSVWLVFIFSSMLSKRYNNTYSWNPR